MWTRWAADVVLLCMLVVLSLTPPLGGQQDGDQQREQIGHALGEPVYRDQIRTGENVRLRGELHRLFAAPVREEYLQKRDHEVTATSAEIAATTAYFDRKHRESIRGEEASLREQLEAVEEQLKGMRLTEEEAKKLEVEQIFLQSKLEPPDRSFASFMLKNWKFQRHLYDEYGGGRILWQQGGLEAFDAMHRWLLVQEESGKFSISDPALRAVFYEYWTTQDHGAFLIADDQRIRREFLEPEWLKGGGPSTRVLLTMSVAVATVILVLVAFWRRGSARRTA